MAIPFSKYVRIISGVGGGVGVRTRDLIARVFTESELVSPGSILQFTSAADVGLYFGTESEEYDRATMYFGFVSPAISTARAISFARYAPTGTDASAVGNNDPKVLATFTAMAGATLVVIANGVSFNVAPFSLATSTSLTDVATAVQTAVRAADSSLTAATVTYEAPRFTIAAPGMLGTLKIESAAPGSNDFATAAGLTEATQVIDILGVAAQTPNDAVIAAQNLTNNYGSFVFQSALSLPQVTALAQANAAENVMFMYSQRVTRANAAAWSAALIGYAGVGLTLQGPAGEYPDMVPPAIQASTDYSKRNAVVNYMYRSFGGLTATVNDGAESDTLDALRVNYYGNTSTAGQQIQFYQRGTLMGSGSAPVDMNVYSNEQWLKDYAGSQCMSLQLSVGRIPANDSGRAMILNILQPVVDAALRNGVVSVGKELTPVQRAYIIQMTGDPLSWIDVQNAGYVLSCVIEPYTTVGGATEYKAVYSLIYSKDDVVRKIEGTHTLV